MCNDAIYSSVERVVKQRLKHDVPRCLDIGAGSGDLLALLRLSWPNMQAEACDYHIERFALNDVRSRRLISIHSRFPIPMPALIW